MGAATQLMDNQDTLRQACWLETCFQTKFRLPGEDGGEELPKNESEVVTARARC